MSWIKPPAPINNIKVIDDECQIKRKKRVEGEMGGFLRDLYSYLKMLKMKGKWPTPKQKEESKERNKENKRWTVLEIYSDQQNWREIKRRMDLLRPFGCDEKKNILWSWSHERKGTIIIVYTMRDIKYWSVSVGFCTAASFLYKGRGCSCRKEWIYIYRFFFFDLNFGLICFVFDFFFDHFRRGIETKISRVDVM